MRAIKRREVIGREAMRGLVDAEEESTRCERDELNTDREGLPFARYVRRRHCSSGTIRSIIASRTCSDTEKLICRDLF